MKNKGLVIFIAIVLALTCVYELSFTFKARSFETKAKTFATKDGKFDGEKYREYIDSLGNKTLIDYGIVKRNYFKCKDSELKLGLDLQGGMNVILEVSKMDVIKSLAGDNSKKAEVAQTLKAAQDDYLVNGGDYVEKFAEKFKQIAPNKTLSSIFANAENKAVTFNTSDADVISYLKAELDGKAQNTKQVIEARLNQGNVSQPNIQELEGGRISVELPGVDNPKRIRTLLEQSAKLEFWETYCNTESNGNEAYFKIYEPMNKFYAQKLKLAKGESLIDSNRLREIEAISDSTQRDSTKKAFFAASKDTATSFPFAEAGLNPLLNGQNLVQNTAILGIAQKTSMNKINKMLSDEYLVSKLPKDVVFAWDAEPLEKDGDVYAVYALKSNRNGKATMGSGDENLIADARASTNPNGKVEVSMMMTNSASREWKDLTTKNQGFNVAIVLDNKVFSAPSVNEPITGGSSSISGSFSVEEATDLANVLKAGKLPAPARIIAEEVVGPTLGAESIKQGFMSFIIGLIAVVVLMIFFYSRAGVIAVGSVLLNIFFIIGILASYGAALTLPGIAGIVLTIGMAVDANVLIYERIREELREGRALKAAVTNGYKAALSSIVDSNITTLLAGFIMTFVGAGPVYGFAITLIIGILSSLFTAILVSRIWIEKRLMKDKEVSFSNNATKDLLVNANYNFIGNRKKFYIISSIIIIVGMSTLIMKGGLSTGIDFKGGYGYTIQLKPGLSPNDLKSALDKGLANSSNEVKTIGSEGRYKIVSTYKLNDNSFSADSVEADVIKSLSAFDAKASNVLTSSKVGPTIANNIRDKSAMVIIISLIVIFIYIVIRFKKVSFGLGATIALVHDVLMVFSIFALLDGIVPFSIEIDQAFIAAILTVVGYSINDSVVVFDRIREYLNEYKSETNVGQLINKAVNQTLTRTIMTSGTTLIVILALFLFGGAALKSFSLALLIGIGIGTYSSICIAAPVVVDMFKKNKGE